MVSVPSDSPYEDILRALTEQAVALWGDERAAAIAITLVETAQQLRDVSQVLPHYEVEPGFYQ